MRTRFLLVEGDFVAEHWQDAEEIAERNARSRADPVRHEMGRPIAEIPNVIALGWYYEEVDKDPTFRMSGPRWNALVRKKLAEPEWKYLRCQPDGSPNFSGWRKS
jgi:hypothetical protein